MGEKVAATWLPGHAAPGSLSHALYRAVTIKTEVLPKTEL